MARNRLAYPLASRSCSIVDHFKIGRERILPGVDLLFFDFFQYVADSGVQIREALVRFVDLAVVGPHVLTLSFIVISNSSIEEITRLNVGQSIVVRLIAFSSCFLHVLTRRTSSSINSFTSRSILLTEFSR